MKAGKTCFNMLFSSKLGVGQCELKQKYFFLPIKLIGRPRRYGKQYIVYRVGVGYRFGLFLSKRLFPFAWLDEPQVCFYLYRTMLKN